MSTDGPPLDDDYDFGRECEEDERRAARRPPQPVDWRGFPIEE